MIEIQNLTKRYGELTVLRDISTTINKGEVISIIGPSGTGKSTLLRCLNLLEHPDGGKIIIDGQNILDPKAHVAKLRQKMGMVFQSFNLFAHLTVLDNLTIGPVRLLHKPRKEAEQRAMELLGMVGLAEKAGNLPDELSGGQKQRVAIARCLSMDPEIILFDEPTSALDPTMISEVLAVIRRLAKEGMTMAIVTHEMDFARDVSNRVFYMDEGVIYESGSPEQVFGAPQREKTINFIHRLRNFTYGIASPTYDLYEMNGEIEQFCEKFFFSRKMMQATLLAVEEALHLYFDRPEPQALSMTLSYSEKTNELTLAFAYGGPAADFITQATDELSLTLLRGFVHNVTWQHTPAGNTVSMTLNENGKR